MQTSIFYMDVYASSVAQAQISHNGADYSNGRRHTARVAYTTNDVVTWTDDVQRGADATVVAPSGFDRIVVGAARTGAWQIYGLVPRTVLRSQTCSPVVCP